MDVDKEVHKNEIKLSKKENKGYVSTWSGFYERG
jgi:hypothetical protein